MQLNSKTDKIDIFKQLPSLNVKNRYSLRIESLTIPQMSSGLILNQPLFTIERRLRQNSVWSNVIQFAGDINVVPHDNTSLPTDDWTFTPHHVKTVSQLVFQMNHFFRKKTI